MPTILKVANVHFTQTGNNRLEYTGNGVVRLTANGIQVPVGSTATRPTGEAGIIRFNTSTGNFEGHNASGWGAIGGAVDLSPAFNQANTAYNQANAAYNRANTRLANATTTLAGSLTIAGSLTTTGNASVGTATLSGGALGTSANNTANTLTLSVTTTNVDNLRFYKIRDGAGSDWTTAGWRIQQQVDVSNMGFVQFNGNGNQNGIIFGHNVSTLARMTSTGNFGLGTTSPSHRLHVEGTGFASTDFRAPIFYNSNDTNARLTAESLVLRGGSPTVLFRDTDGNSAMLNTNGSVFRILRGGNDTETPAQVGSQWPATFDLTNNNCLIGGNLSAIVNVIAYASDKRLKENIVEIPNALEKIRQIRGVTFDWKTDVTEQHGFTPQTATNDIGCIAQEVQAVLPHAVTLAPFDVWRPDHDKQYSDEELAVKKGTSKSGEHYLTIQYERMVPLLIQAIKEQQEQIDALKKEVEELKRK